MDGKCEWLRQFDGHFAIGCVGETGQRANGNFKRTKDGSDAKWDFTYCPYCGREIKVVATGRRRTTASTRLAGTLAS